jgi:hypothetical protein
MIKVAVGGFVSALALCGFSDTAEQDLAKCKLTAIELYRPPANEGSWNAEAFAYVETCMKAAGYRWNPTDQDCASYEDLTRPRIFFPRCWQ